MALYDPPPRQAAEPTLSAPVTHAPARAVLAAVLASTPAALAHAQSALCAPNSVERDLDLAAAQTRNLARLAVALLDLRPGDTPHGFDMHHFRARYAPDLGGYLSQTTTEGDFTGGSFHSLVNPVPHPCGTVACAVGHAPLLLPDLQPLPVDDGCWVSYSDRVFGCLESHPFGYMFGGDWVRYDNTPQGAAARVALILRMTVLERRSLHAVEDFCSRSSTPEHSPEWDGYRNDHRALLDPAQ